MAYPVEQIEELKSIYPGLLSADEGGTTFIFLPQMLLPEKCSPAQVDALLCPLPRDGYPSRLFYSSQIQATASLNWNGQNVRILEKNWFTFSWKVNGPNLTLAQMVAGHLKGLQ